MPMMQSRRNAANKPAENLDYSPSSVLHAMDKFSSAVATMEQNVLVPCRLQDLNDPEIGDLHAAYKLLSKTKVDLLFGDIPMLRKPKATSRQNSQLAIKQNASESNLHGALNGKSTNGSTLNLPDMENNEAFVDPSLANIDPQMLKLYAALNQNLRSLHCILDQMTNSAEKVTNIYLKEVGGSSL